MIWHKPRIVPFPRAEYYRSKLLLANFEAMITIYSPQGTLLLTLGNIGTGSKGYYSLMQHDYIVLKFSLAEPVEFKRGCYVDLTGQFDDALGGKLAKKYYVTSQQTPTYNTSTGGYDYELRLDAYYWLWNNYIFKYTPETPGSEASWSLTAALDVHLGVFLRNLAELGFTFNGTPFTYSIDQTVANKAVAMTYDNTHLLDALFSLGGDDAFDCDVWVTESVIHFGRCELGSAVKIERGVEAESITRSDSKGTFATRIYAFGSTRNIPANYRPIDEQAVVNGVVQKRLMLPQGTPYVDAYENMAGTEVVEDVVVFDDIYPRRVGTLSNVTTRTETVENEDGTQSTYTYYRYKDTGLQFDSDYILEGQELQVTFQSGKMNGMTFGVIFNPDGKKPEEQLWEIVANEDYGRLLPDDTIKPENGDEYVLSGFDIQLVSDQYIPEAEQELLAKAEEYVAKTKVDDGVYTATLMSDWVYADQLHRTFDVGQKVTLVASDFFTNNRASRVIGWEMCLDIPYDHPVYTIGESAQYSRLDNIEQKVDTLTYKGNTYYGAGGGPYVIRTNDRTSPSDSNVFSALRSLATFLRKDKADSTRYLLSLLGGAVFGKDGFAGGMTGFGAKIDDNGDGEMESLTVRRELIVPLLSYNRVDIKVGDKWRAPGGGVIASVDTVNKRCTLRLAEGEIGAIAEGDICMGIFHSEVSADNATEDYDDGKGNRRFAGFTTVYFTITGVEGSRNEAFTYQLRLAEEGHWTGQAEPFEEMQFVAYGNFSKTDRQTSVYETRTYTRMLWKQNTWEIAKANIALQYGDLSNLSVFEMQMQGYSMYLNSVYFTGEITQVKPDGTPVRTANDRGAWQQGHYDYYDRVSHDGSLWLCVAEGGTDSEPREGDAAWLKQVDRGEDGVPGTPGKDGKTLYTWIMYADDAGGGGISNDPTGKEYIGLAYNKETATESDDPADYTWSKIKGDDGKDGEGVNANLLDDTEFASESRMSAWTEGSRPTGDYSDNGIHEGGPQGANYYRCGTWMTEDELQFKDIIQQTVGDRLSKGEWHTLSFWSRSDADWISVNETSAAYGFGLREVRLTAGHRYRFGGNGRVSAAAAAAGVKLVVMIYNADWSWSKEVSITSQADSTVLSELDDVPSTGAYNIRAYASTGTDGETTEVTANSYILQDLDGVMSTYIYPGVVDSGAGGYIDGEWTDSMPSGQGVRWPLDSGWARHTLTFKTLGSFDASTHVLFRLWPSPCRGTAVWADISRPKLETGQSATAYMPGGSDMDGREGQPGCVLRVSEWALGTVYRNDAELATDGVRYLDIAMMRNDASTTGWDAYQCLKTHTSTILNRPISTQGGTYWSKFGANVGAIFTSLIIAKNAKIRFLQGNSITVEKEDGTVTAGMQGSTSGDKTRFWAGSAVPDEAPFRVNEDGKMTAENAVITGYLYKSKTVLTRDNIDDFKIDADDMFTGQFLNLKKTGTWIEFSDLDSMESIYMPSIYPYDTSMTEEEKDYVRSLVGNTILLYNRSNYNVTVTANNKESEEAGPVSFGIQPGWFAAMECKASSWQITSMNPEAKDYEDIYWLFRLGKIR